MRVYEFISNGTPSDFTENTPTLLHKHGPHCTHTKLLETLLTARTPTNKIAHTPNITAHTPNLTAHSLKSILTAHTSTMLFERIYKLKNPKEGDFKKLGINNFLSAKSRMLDQIKNKS